MILNVQQQIHAQVSHAIRTQFGLADVPPFAVEVPPNRALGDLAVTVAFDSVLDRVERDSRRSCARYEGIGVVLGEAGRQREDRHWGDELMDTFVDGRNEL